MKPINKWYIIKLIYKVEVVTGLLINNNCPVEDIINRPSSCNFKICAWSRTSFAGDGTFFAIGEGTDCLIVDNCWIDGDSMLECWPVWGGTNCLVVESCWIDGDPMLEYWAVCAGSDWLIVESCWIDGDPMLGYWAVCAGTDCLIAESCWIDADPVLEYWTVWAGTDCLIVESCWIDGDPTLKYWTVCAGTDCLIVESCWIDGDPMLEYWTVCIFLLVGSCGIDWEAINWVSWDWVNWKNDFCSVFCAFEAGLKTTGGFRFIVWLLPDSRELLNRRWPNVGVLNSLHFLACW